MGMGRRARATAIGALLTALAACSGGDDEAQRRQEATDEHARTIRAIIVGANVVPDRGECTKAWGDLNAGTRNERFDRDRFIVTCMTG